VPNPSTPNIGLYQGAVNSDTGWGGSCNDTFLFLDGHVGGVQNIPLSSSNVAITLPQWQNNSTFRFQGVISAPIKVFLPFNAATGAGAAVGGKFVVENGTTGAFPVSVWTASTIPVPTSGCLAPQGLRTAMYSDPTTGNVSYQDDSRYALLNIISGTPNGTLTGFSGDPSTGRGADIIWDTTNQQLNVCVGNGTPVGSGPGNAGTVWNVVGQNIPIPQGYLSLDNTQIILQVDSVGRNLVGYAPYRGNLIPIFNGSVFTTVSFPALTNQLSASQSANSLYDAYITMVSGSPQLYLGPTWASGSTPGSSAPGASVRGSGGANAAALQRINGIWTNASAITATNSAPGLLPTITIQPGQGTYVGTIGIGGTAGQLSCTRSWGGGGVGSFARRWDVWNAYQRMPITMLVGDNTVSWNNNVNGWRESNGGPNNRAVTVIGLQEEAVEADFSQLITPINNRGAIGINLNNPALTPNGYTNGGPTTVLAGGAGSFVSLRSKLVTPPLYGFNHIIACENPGNNGNETFYGGQSSMYMSVSLWG
jgi:hypothetical protein